MKLVRIGNFFTLFVIWCLVFGFSAPAGAVYDPRTTPNNKAGVHILSPDEISTAADLVNHGGDWGYLTVPIQPSDRDKAKWQDFMHQAKALHLIPIIRITTIPQGGTWEQGHDTDLVDFANFLNELDWPIQNRYVILFNEVNRDTEWGGQVNPEKYARIVKNAYAIFKERSPDFFLLGPSLDLALPNSQTSLSAPTYYARMASYDPLIWTYFDGWSSHSYPNPAFSASSQKTGLQSIVGYKSEFSLLKLAPKPVFITETGWDQSKLSSDLISKYWNMAWDIWQKDPNVVAVTPFILQGGDQFSVFSLTLPSGELSASGQAIRNLPKSVGMPTLSEPKSLQPSLPSQQKRSWNLPPFFQSSHALTKLENILRVILGLPTKASLTLRDHELLVELATTPKHWEKGLSDRTSLGAIDGMLFVFPSAHVPLFWMKDVAFPLDFIWLKDNVVVDITHAVPLATSDSPPTYSPNTPINMVLETRAGWAEENNIQLGDTLLLDN